MKKASFIFLNALPILIMIGLIPLVANDYALTATYLVIIVIALAAKWNRNDLLPLVFGFVVMTIFESIFVSTGIEIFTRNSFLGLMPLWLPLLWAYGFVAIKRSVAVL